MNSLILIPIEAYFIGLCGVREFKVRERKSGQHYLPFQEINFPNSEQNSRTRRA